MYIKLRTSLTTFKKGRKKKKKDNVSRSLINKYTFRMGSEDINVMTAIRSFGKTYCPFGLFISEQT
jgi:hypothetical protein